MEKRGNRLCSATTNLEKDSGREGDFRNLAKLLRHVVARLLEACAICGTLREKVQLARCRCALTPTSARRDLHPTHQAELHPLWLSGLGEKSTLPLITVCGGSAFMRGVSTPRTGWGELPTRSCRVMGKMAMPPALQRSESAATAHGARTGVRHKVVARVSPPAGFLDLDRTRGWGHPRYNVPPVPQRVNFYVAHPARTIDSDCSPDWIIMARC